VVIYVYLFVAMIAFALLYPKDSVNIIEYARLWLKLIFLNYYMKYKAWIMYRRICSDLVKMGMPKPPFIFVPLWQRETSARNR